MRLRNVNMTIRTLTSRNGSTASSLRAAAAPLGTSSLALLVLFPTETLVFCHRHSSPLVIPVLVTGIHRAAGSGACGCLDAGDKPRHDNGASRKGDETWTRRCATRGSPTARRCWA